MTGRPCKTCGFHFREEVDKRAISGWSYKRLSEWIGDTYQVRISHTALKRHCEEHIQGFEPKSKITHKKVSIEDYGLDQTLISNGEGLIDPRYIDAVALRKELGCPENINNSEDLAYTVKRFMGEIVVNQLAIVLTKQKAFMEAKCGYPNNEVRGLNNLISTIGEITSRSKSDRNHFDLDKALDFSNDSEKFKSELLNLIGNTLGSLSQDKKDPA